MNNDNNNLANQVATWAKVAGAVGVGIYVLSSLFGNKAHAAEEPPQEQNAGQRTRRSTINSNRSIYDTCKTTLQVFEVILRKLKLDEDAITRENEFLKRIVRD